MKIAVLVVYYLDPKEEWVIVEHFRRFDLCSQLRSNFNIYAAINRLAPMLHHHLNSRPYVKPVRLPITQLRGNAEHAWYLDQLTAVALKDGCDFICTFDVDSWPISDDFFSTVINLLESNRAEVAAVLRKENGDTFLPHPSFFIASSNFFKLYNPSFFLPTNWHNNFLFKDFLANTGQAIDTGIGVGFELWKNNVRWLPLIRSNAKNYHFLMGGIYGDLIFHMGGTSWGKRFRGEGPTWGYKLTKFMIAIPFIWRLRGIVAKKMESIIPDPVEKRNTDIYCKIKHDLQLNPDKFIDSIR